MSISKGTINELLTLYLEEKGLDQKVVKTITSNLHKDVNTALISSNDKDDIKATVHHGTSCPRIMTKDKQLLVEM